VSIVVLFCILIVKLYIQKIKKYNALIFEQEIAFQKNLNASILETQEQLLKSISQDLHDDAGQQLTVINFQLENLKLDIPDHQKLLEPVSSSVAQLAHSLREISHLLNPNWLKENGFLNAIETEINRIKKQKSIAIQLSLSKSNPSISIEVQMVLFRVFQEILNNILKHAKATKVEVKIVTEPKFVMTIYDNGIGFDVSKAIEKKSSMGLQNIMDRTKIVNFETLIKSAPNNGTTITITEI
jgi:signal transduction histidine kinase